MPVVRASRSTGSSGPRSTPTTITALLDPIGFTVGRRRRDGSRARGRPPVVAAGLHRRRSTSSRRSPVTYGYEQLGKTRAEVDDARSAEPRCSSVVARCARCCSVSGLRGDARPVPAPRRSRRRPAWRDDVVRVANPLVADEDVLRTSLRPGLLKAIAFNESHRRPGVSLFEIGHVYPPGDRSGDLPDEYEALGVVLAGAEAPAAMPCGARSRRRWASAHASTRARCRPACTRPARRRCGSAVTSSARSARSIPTCSRRTGSTSASPCSSSTSAGCSAIEPKIAQWKPIESVSVERPRPRVRRPRFGDRREGGEGDPSGRRSVARRPRAVRRLPWRGRSRGHTEPRATGCGCRRPTAR